MEKNNNTNLIVLIMIGICVILLFVCCFSLMKATKNSAEVEQKEGTTEVENKVEEQEDEKVEIIEEKKIGDYRYYISPIFEYGDVTRQYYYTDGRRSESDVEFNIYSSAGLKLEDFGEYEFSETKKINGHSWTISKNYSDDYYDGTKPMEIVAFSKFDGGTGVGIKYIIRNNVEHADYALMYFDEILNSVHKDGEEIDRKARDTKLVEFEKSREEAAAREAEEKIKPDPKDMTEIPLTKAEDWEAETEIRTIDMNAYDKEVDTYRLYYKDSNRVVEFSIPEDFALNVEDEYVRDNFETSEKFRDSANSVTMTLSLFPDNMAKPKNDVSLTESEEKYRTVQRVTINDLTGFEMINYNYSNVHYSSLWYLIDRDEEGKDQGLAVEIAISLSDEYSDNKINIGELIKSEDYQYILGSIKVYEQ